METRANYVIVGIFTVVAILAAFGFIYWTARIGQGGNTVALRFRIPGSASGLGRGSAVLFNGVKVGDIKRVYIDPDKPSVAIADSEVVRTTPITRSTVADVGIAGLTGQANIELRGGNIKEKNLFDEAEADSRIAEITANPSAVTNLLENAQEIFKRTNNVLSGLEGFVRDTRAPLTDTVKNVDVFSQALKDNSAGVGAFLASAGKLATTLQSVSGTLGSTLDSAKGLLDSVDHQKVAKIVSNVQGLTDRLNAASANLNQIIADADTSVKSVGALSDKAAATLNNVNGAIAKVDGVIASVDPQAVKNTVSNVEHATHTADSAVADVAQMTRKIREHTDDVTQIITNTKDLTHRLNDTSVRINAVVAKVNTMLGSGDANGLIKQAESTLKSIKQVADTLNGHLGEITQGFAKFSTQGLGNVNSLVVEARRAIDRIAQAATSLEKNPQRLLTGGEGQVRQYDGRVRR